MQNHSGDRDRIYLLNWMIALACDYRRGSSAVDVRQNLRVNVQLLGDFLDLLQVVLRVYNKLLFPLFRGDNARLADVLERVEKCQSLFIAFLLGVSDLPPNPACGRGSRLGELDRSISICVGVLPKLIQCVVHILQQFLSIGSTHCLR